MIKKIIILIVVLAAIWAMPAGRAKMSQFLQPVLKHLGPFGEKASGPMKKYAAKTQVAGILRFIEAAQNEGKELPSSRNWVRWLRAHPPSDNKDLDPWGNQFYLKQENGVSTIGSAGPDGVRYNADDIYHVVTL